jgi:hypothetical protein
VNHYTHLKPEDLDILERLLEDSLSPKSKEYLQAIFGKGGHRSQVFAIQESASGNCDSDCPNCNVCAPHMEEPLLYLVTKEIQNLRGESQSKSADEVCF